MQEKLTRVGALDFVRVTAMLSVVLLHTSSAYIFDNTGFTLRGLSVAYLINQAVRYCVPLFFLLSGLSMELSYRPQPYGRFVLSRARRVLLPFLIWSLFYYATGSGVVTVGNLTKTLLFGTAAPQLYFIVALFQLYLLYPFLRTLLREKPLAAMALLFVLSFFMQWCIYLVVFDIHLLPAIVRPYVLKSFLPWLFCFGLGILLAQKDTRWKDFAVRHKGTLMLVTIVFAAFYILDSAATKSYDLSVKPVLFFYVPLVFLCFYGLGEACTRPLPLRRALEALSRHSMTVFFCHIAILDALRLHITTTGTRGMLLLSLATLLLSILTAFLLDGFVRLGKQILKGLRE